MASPVNDTYNSTSAAGVYAGRFAPVPNTVVLLGDSLTDQTLGNSSPYHVTNGLLGGKLKQIGNIGVYGETVQQMLARIDNSYTNANPGMAGFGPVGWVEFRGGTNNARAGAISQGIRDTYTQLFAKLLTYASRVVVKPVPPIGGAEVAMNANVAGFNTFLQTTCSNSNGKLIWIDDCVNLRDINGSQLSFGFISDGIHFSTAGTYQCAVDSEAIYTSSIAPFAYPSPVSTDPLDKYPTQPQWVPNHTNTGTSGSVGNQSGTLPTGWGLWGYGSGISSTASIVSADVGDINQTPWIRITPSQLTNTGNGEAIQLTANLSGRTITSTSPTALDVIVQVRLNNLNTSYFSKIRTYVTSSGGVLSRDLEAKFGGSGTVSKVLTMRHQMPRTTSSSGSSPIIYIESMISGNITGSVGTIDVRCVTVRG